MELQIKNSIYDRLLNISVKVEPKSIPDPRYISEKIGQCHVLIEEVEKFYIRISKEISITQRAFNNSTAAYENARNALIANDEDIRTLPSLRDREARANTLLKANLEEIKGYKNELSDLEELQKSVSLSMKNLTRLNGDIKMQLRLMESQVRLGSGMESDSAARSLVDELNKSTMGADIFEDVETQAEETQIVDPTEPLDMEALIGSTPIQEPAVNTVPIQDPSPEIKEIVNTVPIQEPAPVAPVPAGPAQTPIEEDEKIEPIPDLTDDISSCMPGILEEPVVTPEKVLLDLDKILIPESSAKTGGEPSQKIEEPKAEPEPPQKEAQPPKNPDDKKIDIDSLLSQFH